MASQLPQLRALCIRQPWAELILRGEKTVEYRSKATNIRGEVYIYASLANPDPGQDGDTNLPRGLIVGTVEIVGCSGIDGEYEWQLQNPKRLAEPVAPREQPQPVWFYPFGHPTTATMSTQPADEPTQDAAPANTRFAPVIAANLGSPFTEYHSKYLALELTKRVGSDQADKLALSLSNATVDLNPHQVDAALFAFRSPSSRGAILADEVARENNVRRVKPFMLVVAEDTTHASALKAIMEDGQFFGGQYKGRVIEVHSQQKGVEKDENVQALLSVEDPQNPVEIVIHVNMLKEGWDVTNLYTIVPLRAANSKTLVEQSIGRGLRLPYGKRTGVAAIDRLTIVSHDRFQEIIDEANRPDSIIRTGVIIGRDIPIEKSKVVVAEPKTNFIITGGTTPDGAVQKPLFAEPEEQRVAQTTLDVLREFERLPSSADLKKPEVIQKIIARVTKAVRPSQALLPEMEEPIDIAKVVEQTIDVRNELSIDIPRIIVTPKGPTTSGYKPFKLDCSNVRLQPVSQEILIQHLQSNERFRLRSGDAVIPEARLEDYLVRGLMDFDDIDYNEIAELLYDLAGQMVRHIQSYLPNQDDVLNVLQAHQQAFVKIIHTQMQDHFEESVTKFDVQVSRGFTALRPNNYTQTESQKTRDFRVTVDDKMMIRGLLFHGFKKSLYELLRFQSNTERIMAVVLEKDDTVRKWLKPAKGDFRIYYANDDEYIPDFAVETDTARYIIELKSSGQTTEEIVQAKARAASLWCQRATEHSAGSKPWKYLLIPHDQLDESMTLDGLAKKWEWSCQK